MIIREENTTSPLKIVRHVISDWTTHALLKGNIEKKNRKNF